MSSKCTKLKKEGAKIGKLIAKSDSETEETEHELSYYANDRVKLMKEVLKIIKPKKIKSMAPDCIKDLDIEEINSMLLEELLGISNKRLKYIFNGQNLDEETSSSTDPEEEKQPIDIISLDDVSDDEFVIDLEKEVPRKKAKSAKVKKIKKEKPDKKKEPLREENLMSVLELLELQARARAIRSQLLLEANKKAQEQHVQVHEDSDPDDAVIIEIPKNEEIVIESSDSETQPNEKIEENRSKKITLIRDRTSLTNQEAGPSQRPDESSNVATQNEENPSETKDSEQTGKANKETENQDEDEIILIVDQEEMDGIIGD